MDSLGMGLGAARDDAPLRAPGDFKNQRGLRVGSQKVKLLSGGRGGSRVRRPAASWLALKVPFAIARRRHLEAVLAPTDFQNSARFGSAGTNFPPPDPPPWSLLSSTNEFIPTRSANSLNARTDAARIVSTPASSTRGLPANEIQGEEGRSEEMLALAPYLRRAGASPARTGEHPPHRSAQPPARLYGARWCKLPTTAFNRIQEGPGTPSVSQRAPRLGAATGQSRLAAQPAWR